MQVIPITMSSNTAVHPTNNTINATTHEYPHSLYQPAIFQRQTQWQRQPRRRPRHPPDHRHRLQQPPRPELRPSHQQPSQPLPSSPGDSSAARAVTQSALSSPSSSEPYLASHSACSARRHLRSSCHSGYIHPGNRTGIKPNTPTINDMPAAITQRFRSTPPPEALGSRTIPHPTDTKKPPTAGSITATVLRPRLNSPSSISRAASPQSLSENIANHQATSGNVPNRTQPTPASIQSVTSIHFNLGEIRRILPGKSTTRPTLETTCSIQIKRCISAITRG